MDQASADFIESMGRQYEEDGAPRIAGRLFGLLMLQEQPCSLDDVAEALRVSKGSASSNARLLEQLGVAERVTLAGDRRDYYRISPDIAERTLERAVQGLGRMLQRLRAGEEAAEGRAPAVAERFRDSIDWHERAMGVVSELLGQVRSRDGAGEPAPRTGNNGRGTALEAR